uniref:Phytochrome sensor protein n=1 Tax=Cyanothece sp. (strain PCC 7425 / ATCC 29141) TaxID=395961 RepID=B8HRC7_CYAP4
MPPVNKSTLEAGQIYRATGRIAADILRPEVYRAWERSHLQGASSHTLKAEKLSSLETERLLEKQKKLIHTARPYCHLLSQAAGQERHAVMLGNAEAIVIDVMGHEQSIKGPEAVPGPGSLLSEAVAGANGIATPLAEKNYAELVAAEHFIEGFQPFTCQGIPLRNEQSKTVGVLSISVRRAEVGKQLKQILLCSSHGIEAELLHQKLEEDIQRVLSSKWDNYKILEELRQDIIQAHHAARLKLEVVSRFAAANRFDYTLQLLQQAEASLQIFRRRAQLWRDLASSEVGDIQPLSLTQSLQNFVDLLSTETVIRKLEIVMHLQEEVIVMVDSKRLLRTLLHYFLQAFEIAGRGGAIDVQVEKSHDSKSAELFLRPIPAIGSAKVLPKPIILKLPIAIHQYE